MEVDGAVLYEFIVNAARDVDPLKDGYQVSAVYLFLCLLVPKAMGLAGAIMGFMADWVLCRGNVKE